MKDFLKQTFFFSGLNETTLEKLIQKFPPVVRSYKRGECIYPSCEEKLDVGFVIEGRCEIRRPRSENGKTVLNILEQNDSFGILSVFSNDKFPTEVFATKNSKILFFSNDQIKEFVNNSSQISLNVINFLANRIFFLNNKIATFSGNTVECRLAKFLHLEYKTKGNEFPFNALKTSEEINAGRASVYRALDLLGSNGLIILSDKKIKVIDPEGLERIS